MKSAEATLKEAIEELRKDWGDGSGHLGKGITMLRALEVPPAAERTASADIAQAIWENDDFQDALEMIRHGIKQEQFTAYTTILQAIKSEIDAASASEPIKVARFYKTTPLANRIMALIKEGKTIEEAVEIASASEGS